jgi:hypothetical protein
VYNPHIRVESLLVTPISKASVQQTSWSCWTNSTRQMLSSLYW